MKTTNSMDTSDMVQKPAKCRMPMTATMNRESVSYSSVCQEPGAVEDGGVQAAAAVSEQGPL